MRESKTTSMIFSGVLEQQLTTFCYNNYFENRKLFETNLHQSRKYAYNNDCYTNMHRLNLESDVELLRFGHLH